MLRLLGHLLSGKRKAPWIREVIRRAAGAPFSGADGGLGDGTSGVRQAPSQNAGGTAPPADQCSVGAYVAAGDAANRERRWADAARAYEQALACDPSLAAIWIQYGHARKELGAFRPAELAYRRARSLSPDDADALLQLGHLLKLQGRSQEALEAYAEALRISPQLTDAAAELAALGIMPELRRRAKLPVELAADASDRMVGEAWIELGLIVTGWCVDLAAPDRRLTVAAVGADGSVVAQGTTGRRIAEERDQGAMARSGFRFALPRSLLDGKRHILSVTIDGEPSPIGPVEVDGTTTGYGWVETVSRHHLAGWALSYADPAGPAAVEALIDGQLVGGGLAETFRPDIAAAIGSSGFHGFTLRTERRLSPADIEALSVRLASSGTLLSISSSTRKAAAAALRSHPPTPPTGHESLVGRVDRVDATGVSGWACNTTDAAARVSVSLKLDGVTVGSVLADAPRPDVGRDRGTDGRHGFHIGFPPGLGITGRVKAEVVFTKTGRALTGSPQIHDAAGPGLAHPGGARSRFGIERLLHAAPEGVAEAGKAGGVALIVVNLNGAQHLRSLLQSFHRHHGAPGYRVVVVDHGSRDESRDVCRDWASKLDLEFIARGHNASFSSSNNLAADRVGERILFFVNNDIVFTQPVTELISYLEDPKVGVVGMKLRSPPTVLGTPGEAAGPRDSFVQHLGVKFAHRADKSPVAAYELPGSPETHEVADASWTVPAVTGAAIMIRRSDFLAVGGFDERYRYGYEDVDLCLSVRALLDKSVVCVNSTSAYHVRGATRAFEAKETRDRFAANFGRLRSRHGAFVRRAVRREAVDGERLFRFDALRVAFAVSTTDMAAPEADFFTAHELGGCLVEHLGWRVTYLPPSDWYDLAEFDVVVAMRHDFDPRKVMRSNWNLAYVAWPRNWFERWIDAPWLSSFDVIWSASKRAVASFSERTTAPVEFMPIATNDRRFSAAQPREEYRSDYCFTGSFFRSRRDIIDCLDPDALPYTFALFGHNWGEMAWLAPFWRNAVPYHEMPRVYASTKIVVDDANHTVKPWGSVNSRVFDAIAAGRLVVTNGAVGNDEVLDGILPTYSSAAELSAVLSRYLQDEEARGKLVSQARELVLSRHTYRHRAREAHASLRRLLTGARFSVRDLPPTSRSSTAARLIVDQLRARGCWARLRSGSGAVDAAEGLGDDVVFHVSAADAVCGVELSDEQTNVRVHLGPLDSLSPREAKRFDVLVAVDKGAAAELARHGVPVLALFEKAADVRESYLVGEGGSILFVDARRLRRALQAAMPEILRIVERVGAKKHAPRTSEREAERAASRGTADTAVELFYWPDYSSTNPYQRMLYAGAPGEMDVRPGPIDAALAAQGQAGRKSPVVFHLHWTSPVLGLEETEPAAAKRLDTFVEKLAAFKGAGGRLAWTVHNILPHEVTFPDLEVMLCKAAAEAADVIHVHSECVAALAKPFYDLPSEKIVVGRHGNYIGAYPDEVDRATARASLGLSGGRSIFLFFGQIRGYKGVSELLDAFAGLGSDAHGATLLVVGKPVNMDPAEIASRSAALGNVRLVLAEVRDDEIQLYMRAADFVVLPYTKVLTSGSTYLAASFGVPVIAPRSGLVPEVIRDGEEGLLYDPDDKRGLETSLRKALALPARERSVLGGAARARASALDWSGAHRVLGRDVLAATAGRRVELDVHGVARRCFIAEPDGQDGRGARVAAIVLHYRHLDDTIRCVASLIEQDYPSFHVYVVSNDEDAVAFATLARLNPACTVVQSPDNLGYAGGNNIGIALARARGAEYLWIVNPDAVAPRDHLAKMVEIADLNEKVSIFGSKILLGDRPDTVWFAGGRIDFEHGLQASHLHIGERSADVPEQAVPCDYVTGASLFVRTSVIDAIGYLPEHYFLYFEEAHWCLVAKRLGMGIATYPEAHLLHFKRSEEGGAPTPTFLYYYCRNALLMCADFEPGKLEQTEQRLREKASIWIRRVEATRPCDSMRSQAALEAGIADGRARRSGRVDFPGHAASQSPRGACSLDFRSENSSSIGASRSVRQPIGGFAQRSFDDPGEVAPRQRIEPQSQSTGPSALVGDPAPGQAERTAG